MNLSNLNSEKDNIIKKNEKKFYDNLKKIDDINLKNKLKNLINAFNEKK